MPGTRRKTISWAVIVDGVKLGQVRSGKNASGKVRHVATTADGARVGTFDTYPEAEAALKTKVRGQQWPPT